MVRPANRARYKWVRLRQFAQAPRELGRPPPPGAENIRFVLKRLVPA